MILIYLINLFTLYPTDGINYLATGGESIGKYTYKLYNDNPVIINTCINISNKDLNTGSLPSRNAEKYARKLGKRNDDAGHILARHLGGLGEPINIFPQAPHVNRGSYKVFESIIYDCMKSDGVDFGILDWKFLYKHHNQTRPNKVEYQAKFQGNNPCEPLYKVFPN